MSSMDHCLCILQWWAPYNHLTQLSVDFRWRSGHVRSSQDPGQILSLFLGPKSSIYPMQFLSLIKWWYFHVCKWFLMPQKCLSKFQPVIFIIFYHLGMKNRCSDFMFGMHIDLVNITCLFSLKIKNVWMKFQILKFKKENHR